MFHAPEKVTHIDRAKREVYTSEGQRFKYSTLVLAAGPWTNRTLGAAGLSTLPLFVSAEQLLYLQAKANLDMSKFSSPQMCITNGSFLLRSAIFSDRICAQVCRFCG